MKVLFTILIVIVLCAQAQCSSSNTSQPRRIDSWQQVETEKWLR